MIFKIALRNIFRHKRRTFISAITIAFGLAVFILMDSLMSGVDRASLENMINLTDGSIKIMTKEYAADKMAYPLKYGITNPEAFIRYVESLPEKPELTPRLQFLSEIIGTRQSLRVAGTVIDPVKDRKVFALPKYISSGAFFSKNNGQEVLLGKNLARDLGVGVGDTVMLSAQTRFETNNALDFQVAGILETAAPGINQSGVFITFEGARQLLDSGELVTEYDVHIPWSKLEDSNAYNQRLNGIKEKFQQKFPALSVNTFYDANRSYIEIMGTKRKSQSMLVFFILLIGAVGIVNTVLMSVYERIREVGVLRALGIKPKEIERMFIYEGMLIGVTGGLMGMIAGFLGNLWLVNTGWDVTSMMKDFDASQFPIWGVFYGQWSIKSFVTAFILGVAIAVLAAIVPARKAAKITPTQCLKFV
ncbi:MAG: ABC transporter permease [Firmicutes bacterium]|nr:ABC transporter permease [Bacillota bacterium]